MDSFLKNISLKFTQDLKIVHINAQSLDNTDHFSEFNSIFPNSGFDIIGVSETFFKSTSNKSMHNYNVFSVDRIGRGGGVAVYVKDCYKTKILESSSGETGRPEFILLEICIGTTVILCACIYRPPDIGFLDNFLDAMYNHICKYKYVFVCGDINARFGSNEPQSEKLKEVFHLCNQIFIPYAPTFHSGNCHSYLDIISSNCNDLLLEHGQEVAPGFSHHDLLYAVFNVKTPRAKKKTVTFRNLKNIDVEKLLVDANNLPWENVYCVSNVDDKVALFNEYTMTLLDLHAPLRTVNIKEHDEPWMTRELKDSMKIRDKLWKKQKASGRPEDFEVYRKFRNECKQKNRNARVAYYNKMFETSKNSSFIWAKVKQLGIGGRINNNTSIPVMSANELVQHYAEVCTVKFENEVSVAIKEYENRDFFPSRKDDFHFKYIVPEQIIKAMSSIKSNAKGIDNIPVIFLSYCLPVTVNVIEHIFNFCLQNSVFPTIWKQANVVPIPKHSQPTECKDYRPVSLLCILSKILEKLVHEQVVEYINMIDAVPKLQSGFRKGHSTVTALLKVTNDIKKAMDDGKITILALLDLSKAFDCVHHQLLLTKLRCLGFSKAVVKWFQSYLTGRMLRVCLNEVFKSDWAEIFTCVPQGSTLGPLLFLLYLFDLPSKIVHCKYHLYADDTQLYVHTPINLYTKALDCISSDIENLTNYFKMHNLSLNVGKTQVLKLGTYKMLAALERVGYPELNILNCSVPYVKEAKNLGVLMDCNLNWDSYCNNMVHNVFKIIAQLRRNISYLPLHVKKLLVQSLVMPQFDYALALLTGLSDQNLMKLQKAQNAAIRFIKYIPKHQHVTPLFKELNILRLNERRDVKVACLVWRIFKYQSPSYLFELFNQLFVSNRSTRCGYALKLPVHRTTVYNRSFVVEACRIFNYSNMHQLLDLSETAAKNAILKLCLLK